MNFAEMWWGQTSVAFPEEFTVEHGPTGFVINGKLDGPDGDIFSIPTRTRRVSFISQFFLGPERMPSGGCDFISNPSVLLKGDMHGRSFDLCWFDNPSFRVNLELRQIAYIGDQEVERSERDITLMSLMNAEGVRSLRLNDTFTFDVVRLQLDRRYDLQIDLELTFEILVEGGAVFFGGFDNVLPVTLDTPQWLLEGV